jgi:hypothetical protein
VDYRYGSAFQGFYDSFVEEACNFAQVGRYHRFWVNSIGSLRVIVVTPQTPSSHPEWHELFAPNRPDILNMRVLDRRIGYFINSIEKGKDLKMFESKQQIIILWKLLREKVQRKRNQLNMEWCQ